MFLVSKRAYPEFEAHVAEPWHKLGCGAVPSISTTPFSEHPSWGPTPGRRVRVSCSCSSCSVGGVWSSSRTSAWWSREAPDWLEQWVFFGFFPITPISFLYHGDSFCPWGSCFLCNSPLLSFFSCHSCSVQGVRMRCCLLLPCWLAVRTLLFRPWFLHVLQYLAFLVFIISCVHIPFHHNHKSLGVDLIVEWYVLL